MNLDFSFYNWDLISNFVLKGLYFSLMLTVVATIGGVVFGTLLALMRLSGCKWLDVPATIYVNGMRSIPLVMVILWFFLLMPTIIGRPIGAEVSAVVTFIAFEAAYFSEIMRAGIQSIPRGQVHAGQALGMTFFAGLLQQLLQLLFINSGLCRRLLHHFGLRLGLGLGLVRDRRRKPVELRRAGRDEGRGLHGLEGIARRIHRTKAPPHHGAVVNFFLRNKARIGAWRLAVRHNCPPRYCR